MYMTKKMRQDKKGVSPVVATLMLVLVAVASVTAFYVWETSWQKDATKTVGNGTMKSQISLAGSTTLNDFAVAAATKYMTDNPNSFKVSVAGGGSGFGITSAGTGAADIGMSSDAISSSQYALYPGLKTTKVAYDAVVVIIANATLNQYLTAGANHNNLTVTKTTMMNVYGAAHATPATYNWTSFLLASGFKNAEMKWNTAHTAYVGNGTTMTTVGRSESSGTEAGFRYNYLDGTDGQLGSTAAAYKADVDATGNNGVITSVQTNLNYIGFASWGIAKDVTGATGVNMAKCNGIVVSAANTYDQSNGCSRALLFVTNGDPAAEAKTFIQYVLDNANNKAFAASAGMVSIYGPYTFLDPTIDHVYPFSSRGSFASKDPSTPFFNFSAEFNFTGQISIRM